MKISEIPTINYLPLKTGIVFRPLSDDCKPQDDSPTSHKKKYDVAVLCLNDNCEYILTVSQTKGAKKIFNLVKASIGNGFQPIRIVSKTVGTTGKYYNNYEDSHLYEMPTFANPGSSGITAALAQDNAELDESISEATAQALYFKIALARESGQEAMKAALIQGLLHLDPRWKHAKKWFESSLAKMP